MLLDNSAMDEIEEDESPQYTRLERRALTHKGQLPCEWCFHWVDVGFGPMSKRAWLEYVKENPYTVCTRKPCVKHRNDVFGEG